MTKIIVMFDIVQLKHTCKDFGSQLAAYLSSLA